MNRSLKIAMGSLAVSAAVLVIKYAAYLVTGSIALHSDALEGIINARRQPRVDLAPSRA
ncbi:hypothetical protein JQ557_08195 [Bradyrhizobium sp. U87765 SZCCT0131]|uniref:hypothetical protein n=1 Tax=unclassified Bradyrhizobium TaxID=2631580 RepID=UPI001BAB85B3|nr:MULTISPECIES: hypothetical protein [unclassified Bradyrhizobium]MBR1217965.1 hypothetical protein [Bradyrhizobium sp. U87765 SZCCT0131]MBR1261089.1 hypothetical protein [Bradyrhizobium sp. U87765 SZCCT0134]MBR1303463.1 hypothetical protein [Bradyrhizobium sp. U87765 SZCCT0110]MBR1319069.1 hypothetical protein [Bradyrhizobium sp. U87765 SZCCT0109]MBR1347394.1 hypothetical protein [Bradyrhizobium sp. U87765 SZCCT0048]